MAKRTTIPEAAANTATYLYCLVESKQSPSLTGVPLGLPGIQKPRALDAGGSLWLIAGDAPLSRYGTAPIEARLTDLDWVADCAVAHERVTEHMQGTVVPMKLFTLFSSDARAIAHIAATRKQLRATIRRIAGCREWGVRIHFAGPSGDSKQTSAGRASSGTAFLLSKKKRRDRALDIAEKALKDGQAAYRELAGLARKGKRLPIVKGDGQSGPRVILNAAFLVPSERAERFRKACQQAASRFAGTCTFATSGPWPPYNFIG